MRTSKLTRVGAAATMAGLAACLALALPAAQAKSKHVTATKTFTSGDLALLAPDPNTALSDSDPNLVRSFIGVGGIPDKAKIKDVNVSVRITADAARDVEAYLATPRGVIDLTSDNSAVNTDNDYGTGAPDCSGTPTVFDDQTLGPVTLGVAPFAGSFAPEQPLSSLNGLKGAKAKVRWTLGVMDDDPGGAVTLNCWKLSIRYRT